MSAGAWAVVTILLWIIGFPAYLIKRKSLIEKAIDNPVVVSGKWLKVAGLAVIGLLLIAGSFSQLPITQTTEGQASAPTEHSSQKTTGAVQGYKQFVFGMTKEQVKTICENMGNTFTERFTACENDIDLAYFEINEAGVYQIKVSFGDFTQDKFQKLNDALTTKYVASDLFTESDLNDFNKKRVKELSSLYGNGQVQLQILRTTSKKIRIYVYYYQTPVTKKGLNISDI